VKITWISIQYGLNRGSSGNSAFLRPERKQLFGQKHLNSVQIEILFCGRKDVKAPEFVPNPGIENSSNFDVNRANPARKVV